MEGCVTSNADPATLCCWATLHESFTRCVLPAADQNILFRSETPSGDSRRTRSWLTHWPWSWTCPETALVFCPHTALLLFLHPAAARSVGFYSPAYIMSVVKAAASKNVIFLYLQRDESAVLIHPRIHKEVRSAAAALNPPRARWLPDWRLLLAFEQSGDATLTSWHRSGFMRTQRNRWFGADVKQCTVQKLYSHVQPNKPHKMLQLNKI